MSTERPGSPQHEDRCLRQLLQNCHALEHELGARSVERFLRGSLRESEVAKVDSTHCPGSFIRSAFAVAAAACFLPLIVAAIGLAAVLRAIPDQRLGRDYRQQTISTLASNPNRFEIYAGTASGGLISLRTNSEFLQTYTQATTRSQLLTDHIAKAETGTDQLLYLLCRDNEQPLYGLCRFDPAQRSWKTLVGMRSFPELTAAENTARITDVEVDGDQLFIGTNSAGLGVYQLDEHQWRSIYSTATGLRNNEIRDLQSVKNQGLYVASAGGLQQLQNGRWRDVDWPVPAVSPNPAEIAEHRGDLYLRTTTGGLYRRQGNQWITVASESAWASHTDRDLQSVLTSDDEKRWWFLTTNGAVGEYEFKTRTWRTLPALPTPASGLGANPFRPGGLLAATGTGVWELPPAAAAWQELAAADAVVNLSADRSGILFGTRKSPEQAQEVHYLRPNQARSVLVGSQRAADGGALVAASLDSAGGRLFVGGENGVSTYDLATHSWSRPSNPALLKSVLDLQATSSGQLVLTGSGVVGAWNPATDQLDHLLGGGELPRSLAQVTAVTRLVSGDLLLASPEGLFVYDNSRHFGQRIAALPGAVSEMSASQLGAWLLMDGKPFLTSGQNLTAAVPGPAPFTRLLATPNSPGAVALDANGRVFYYTSATLPPATVVGEAAAGLDLNAIETAAISGNRLLVGGPDPHLYDIATRSWHKLPLGNVLQIATTTSAAWLCTADRKLFRLPINQITPQEDAARRGAVRLAVDGNQVVVLQNDFSVWVLAPAAKDWSEWKSAAAGPLPSALNGKGMLVAGQGSALDLVQEDGTWWRFDWRADRWRSIRDGSTDPVTALASTDDSTFALRGAAIYQARFLTNDLKRVSSNQQFLTLRTTESDAFAVDRQRQLWRINANGLQRLSGSPLAGGEPLRDIAAHPTGLLLANGKKTALLRPDLNQWREITGAAIQRMHTAGDEVYGVDQQSQLWRFESDAWRAQPLGANRSGIRAITDQAGPDGKALTVTLRDGAVFRVQKGEAQQLRGAAPALGSAHDVVAIAEVPDGVLCATRTGKLWHCRSATLEWTNVAGPQATGYSQLVTTGSGVDQAWWLLTADQRLLFNKTAGRGPWEERDQEVQSIAVAQDDLLVTTKGGTLVRHTFDGNQTELIKAAPPQGFAASATSPGGQIVAAGELAADDRNLLLLADGNRTAVYDPQLRRWTSLSLPASQFQRTRGGAIAITPAGGATHLRWNNDRVETTAVALPGGRKVVGDLGDSKQFVARVGNASVELIDDTGRVQPLVDRDLVVGPAVQIDRLAAHGEWLFVALSDGTVRGYHRQRKEWKRLGAPGVAVRLEAFRDQAWIETAAGGVQQLKVWREQDGDFAAVDGQLLVWRVTPAGIAAAVRNPKTTEVTVGLWDGARNVSPFAAQLPAGPVRDQVTAVRANDHGFWLHARDRLHQYDSSRRLWTAVSPQAGFLPQAAYFQGAAPLLHDTAGNLWIGNRSAKEPGPWSFMAGPAKVLQADAAGDRFVFRTAGGIGTARFDSPSKLAEMKTTSAWVGDATPTIAAVHGQQIALATEKGAVASYDLAQRTWTRLPPLRETAERLVWLDAELQVLFRGGNSARWTGKEWEPAQAVSSKSWKRGAETWNIHPAGGIVAGEAKEAAVDAALTSSEPVRCIPSSQDLWLEMADGSLLQYAVNRQRLQQRVATTTKAGSTRTGLIMGGKGIYFVQEDVGQVQPLNAAAGDAAVRIQVAVKRVLTSTDSFALDSEAELQVFPGNKILKGAERTAWLKQATLLDSKRMQSASEWRIVDAGQGTRTLERKAGSSWMAYPLDAKRARFIWDDVREGLTWGSRTVAATPAGILVWTGAPHATAPAYFPVDAPQDAALELRLVRHDDARLLVIAADGRNWTLPAAESQQPLELKTLEAPKDSWVCDWDEKQLKLSLLLDGQPKAVSLSANGTLGIDQFLSVGAAEKSVWVATPSGLLKLSPDLRQILEFTDTEPGDLAPHPSPPGLLFRRKTSGEVLMLSGDEWRSAGAELWQQAMRVRALADRVDADSTIEFSLPIGEAGAPAKVEYLRSGRLASDLLGVSKGRALFTSDGKTIWRGNALGVLASTLELASDGHEKSTTFIAIPGGVDDLQWQLELEPPQLRVVSSEGPAYHIENGKALPLAAPSNTRVAVWGGAVYRYEVQPRTVRLTDAENASLLLDLDAGGFRHEQISQVATSSRAVWLALAGSVERITPGVKTNAERFALRSAKEVKFRRAGDQLLADDGATFYRLADAGPPAALEIDLESARRLRQGFQGTRWRADQLASLAGIAWRAPAGNWLATEYRPGSGLLWDQCSQLIVANGDLYLAGPQGVLQQSRLDCSLEAGTLLPLADAQTSPRLDRFVIGTAGRVWAQTAGGNWQRLAADKKSWEAVAELPAADRDLGRVLFANKQSAWVQTDRGVEYRDSRGQLVVGWDTQGFALQDVAAAAETASELWLLTRSGLWKQSAAGLLSGDTRREFQGRDGAFAKDTDRLRLTLKEPGPARFVATERGWVADDTAAETSQSVWEQANFRVRKQGAEWQFEIRSANRWLPVKFDATLGQYSFQAARDAAASARFVHTLTDEGVATWSLEPTGLTFQSLQVDLKELGNHPESKEPLARADGGPWQAFDGKAWKEMTLPQGLLYGETDWRVAGAAGQSATIQRRVKTDWVDLPLASDGDFQYRRPSAIALHNAELWTMSAATLAHYPANSPTLIPTAHLGLKPPLSEVFSLNGKLYAGTGESLVQQGLLGVWEHADYEVSRGRRNQLIATKDWRWSRDARGQAQISRVLPDAEHSLAWDRTAGRFAVDQVHRAAPQGTTILLSTAAGMTATDANGGATLGMLSNTNVPGRFAFDRVSDRLHWQARPGEATALPIHDKQAQTPPKFGPPVELAGANCFNHAYLDSEWAFQLGTGSSTGVPAPQVSWHGLKTGVTNGRFHHDTMRALLLDGDTCWLTTRAGLLAYSFRSAQLQRLRHIPWATEEGRLVAIDQGRPVVHFEQGTQAANVTATNSIEWERLPVDQPDRVLIDTPLWTWTRGAVGLTTALKISDQPEPRDLLKSGPFPFDNVNFLLADDAQVWLGVSEGVAVRSAADGSLVHWHTQGHSPDGAAALGKIVRLARFDNAGNPLPVAADRAVVAQSVLCALNEAGQCWQWDAAAAKWSAAPENLWAGPFGDWIIRSDSLQASSQDGEVQLTCRLKSRAAKPDEAAPVAIRDGRLTCDVVRDIAFAPSELYLASDAGLVRATPDGAFAQWWPSAADNPQVSLAGCREVARHQEQDELFCATPDGAFLKFDRERDGWISFQPDETYRRTARLLHRNDFWTWSRWAGDVDMRIERCDVQPYDGPVFVDGRFSFDVIRDIRRSGSGLFALTAAGVIEYDPASMQVRSLSRRALDPAANELVPLPDAASFRHGSDAVLESANHEYRYQDTRWIRTPRIQATKERVFTDGGRQVTLSLGARSGVQVAIRRDGVVLWQGTALANLPASQIVDFAWVNGQLWITTKNQIYRWQPPRS